MFVEGRLCREVHVQGARRVLLGSVDGRLVAMGMVGEGNKDVSGIGYA